MERSEISVRDTASAADARRHVAFRFPHARIIKTRRIDPTTPRRGFIVVVEGK